METKKTPFTNLRRFFQLLKESLPSLLLLNLIFILTALPIFTLGPALTALSFCIRELIKGDIPEETPFQSYCKIFRSCFKKALGFGLLPLLALPVLLYAFLYYLRAASGNLLMIPLASCTLLGLLFLCGVLLHLFALLGDGEETALLKKAAYSFLTRLLPTLVSLFLGTALFLAELSFFPNTLPLLLLLGFSLPALILGFSCQDGPDYL